MRKHLFSFIAAALLCAGGGADAYADDITFGITSDYSSFTAVNNSSDISDVSQFDGNSVAHASKNQIWFDDGSTTAVTTVAKAVTYKVGTKMSASDDNVYFAFSAKVANGKVFKPSKISVDLGTYGDFLWKVSITDGTTSYTSSNYQIKNYSTASPTNMKVDVPLSLDADLSGDVVVKLYYWINGTGKYITAKNFTVSGTIEDAPAESQVATPTATFSEINLNTHTYNLTLSCKTVGATIKYSQDNGSSWNVYTEGDVITVAPEETIKVQAIDPEGTMTDSEIGDIVAPTPSYSETSTATANNAIIDGTSFSIAGTFNAGQSNVIYSKIRINRTLEGKQIETGDTESQAAFRIAVKEGYVISKIVMTGKCNINSDYKGGVSITDVVVDGVSTGKTDSIPGNDADNATITFDDLNAVDNIDIYWTPDENIIQALIQFTVYYTLTDEAPELVKTVSFATVGYATLFLDKNVVIPSGVTAYTGAISKSGEYLNLSAIESGVIPANTGVVLEGTVGATAEFYTTSHTNITAIEGNALSGTTTAIATSTVSGTVYTLANENDQIGFYKFAGETLAANKAYLVVSEGKPAPVVRFNFGAETEEPGNVTSINTVTIENRADNVIYDLRGRRVLSLDRPGLYIVNGKKIAVK